MANPDAALIASLSTVERKYEADAIPVYIGNAPAANSTTYEVTATDSVALLQSATAPVNALTGLNAVRVTLKLSPGATIGDNWIAAAWSESAGDISAISAALAGVFSAVAVSALARDGTQSYLNAVVLDATQTVDIYASDDNARIQEIGFKNKTATAADIPITVTVWS